MTAVSPDAGRIWTAARGPLLIGVIITVRTRTPTRTLEPSSWIT